MHRSGTSVITHWLHACGLQVGECLLGPDIGNLEGHFEDEELYRFHRGWLEECGLSYSGFVDAPIPGLPAGKREQLRGMLEARDRRFIEWGWKDPRTCLFLDVYAQLLPDAFYLVVLRDFRLTVSSMILRLQKEKDRKYANRNVLQRWLWFKVRRGMKRREASRFLKVWIFYNRRILERMRGLDRDRYVVVDCNMLLRHDREVFAMLTKQWGFSLDYVPFRDIHKPVLVSAPLDIEDCIGRSLWEEAEELQRELAALAGDCRPREAAGPARPRIALTASDRVPPQAPAMRATTAKRSELPILKHKWRIRP
jgi:hypothetical protein